MMDICYLINVSLAPFAFLVAEVVYRKGYLSGEIQPYFQIDHGTFYLAIILIPALLLRLFISFDSKRKTSFFIQVASIQGIAFLSWLFFAGFLYIFNYMKFPLSLLILFGCIYSFLSFLFYILFRAFLRVSYSHGHNLRKVLIVGVEGSGQDLARALMGHPWWGYSVVGFLDNNPQLQGKKVLNIPVIGTLNRLRGIVPTYNSDDEVIISLTQDTYSLAMDVMQRIEDYPVKIRVLPNLTGMPFLQSGEVENFLGTPLIGIHQPAITFRNAVAKRLIDLVGCIIGLIIFSPTMILVAILIKLDSKGPVFFVQERAGENGQAFRIYKFRTMFCGSEKLLDQMIKIDELEEPVFKLKNDPRVTRIGRFLRRTSLDELPQLLNILKGEMSLVGPRPEEIQFVNRYNWWHRQRLMIKPGLTGPAQVHGRGDLSLKSRVDYELEYINNYSIWKDIKIILETIPAVVRGDGSY
jgi:exopolysaccharide biosynthesis polyprenyl glycosylphosphotransferase